jgi:hypothetical protein
MGTQSSEGGVSEPVDSESAQVDHYSVSGPGYECHAR